MILRTRPLGKSHGRPIPKLLNRHQQATLAVRVVAAFLFIAVVLVVAFIIPRGRMALTGEGMMEKRMGGSPAPADAADTTAAAGAITGGSAATGAGAAAKVEAEHQEEHEEPGLLFEKVVLQDSKGNTVEDPMKALEGRAVGLLFGALWCPVCQNYFPRIQEWIREAGRHGDIAIVYVSSDTDAAAAASSQSEHGWDFAVPFDDEALRSRLKAQYKVWAMRESNTFGKDRDTGIPTLVAVDPKGHVLAHMDVEGKGMEALEGWRYKEWAW